MRYKVKVLARFPDARVIVMRRWPDAEPKYVAVFASEKSKRRLDIHEPDDEPGWGGCQQLAGAAWRSAYFWIYRNPERYTEKETALGR